MCARVASSVREGSRPCPPPRTSASELLGVEKIVVRGTGTLTAFLSETIVGSLPGDCFVRVTIGNEICCRPARPQAGEAPRQTSRGGRRSRAPGVLLGRVGAGEKDEEALVVAGLQEMRELVRHDIVQAGGRVGGQPHVVGGRARSRACRSPSAWTSRAAASRWRARRARPPCGRRPREAEGQLAAVKLVRDCVLGQGDEAAPERTSPSAGPARRSARRATCARSQASCASRKRCASASVQRPGMERRAEPSERTRRLSRRTRERTTVTGMSSRPPAKRVLAVVLLVMGRIVARRHGPGAQPAPSFEDGKKPEVLSISPRRACRPPVLKGFPRFWAHL